MLTISVVIPTRNRHSSLLRTLRSLDKQIFPLREIIIVDSSDEPLNMAELEGMQCKDLIRYIQSEPSVCIQRNIGIKLAESDYVFLCDDDIEVEPDYLKNLANFIETKFSETKIEVGAVTGSFLQKENDGTWKATYDVNRFVSLLFVFIFQLSIWGRIDRIKTNIITLPMCKLIWKFYQRRGNRNTLAGWPLITQIGDIYRTKVYTLGGCLVKRTWLLDSPYDEILDPNGLGDNFGVAVDFPQDQAIHVLRDQSIYHHRSPENRLKASVSYMRRVLALHYFLHQKKQFGVSHRLWFMWSLLGNLCLQIILRNRDMVRATFHAIKLILMGRNPYILARNRGSKIVIPN